MARRTAEVTWKKADGERIPDEAGAGVAVSLDLDRRGVLEQIGARLKIRRKGGFCAFDAFYFLLLYFMGDPAVGIRKFWGKVHLCRRKLGAVARRIRLMSPASLSRALAAVESELVRPVTEWLLSEAAGIDAVLRHPSVQTYDALGQGWHVLDFDPTITTLRQRALPKGEDLPEERRLAERMAAPGYSGRKRGDVQFSRGTLQHAGSAAWLQAMLGPGNGDGHAALDAALDVVVRMCARLGHPLERALLRMDGGFGWVPFLAACRARGVPFITRLTRLEMFEQPGVLQALRKGIWHLVLDSLSGPKRSALDLGMVTVPPGINTRRADGSRYDPVAVRVVVSRYPRTDKGKTAHGCLIDGWQYEMFAVDVAADALPAPEAVAMYFGRAGQENRFAQEDHEVGLDRIFSYHLPGQEFAVVVGLWVWNLRLVRGFELAPPPVRGPRQEPYVPLVDDRGTVSVASVLAGLPPAGSPNARLPGGDFQSPTVTPDASPRPGYAVPEAAMHDGPPRTGPSFAATEESAPAHPAGPAPAHAQHAPEAFLRQLVAELSRIDWRERLRKHPGWWWDATSGYLHCRAGRELFLTTVRKGERARGRTSITFCRPFRGCATCTLRTGCAGGGQQRTWKHVELSVPVPLGLRLQALLQAYRMTRRQARACDVELPGTSFPLAPLAPAPAQFAVLPALFLPAAARSILRTAASGLTVAVTVLPQPPRQPRPLLIADSVADKQHRRKTWPQNFERYALDPEVQVHVEIAGGDALRRLLVTRGEQGAA